MSLTELDAFLAHARNQDDLLARLQDETAPLELSAFLQLARAEGFTNVAKTDEVIIRRIVRGKEQKLEVNATELMKARSSASDYPLEPGDVVVIPTRFF
jgi:hypothetical protein